MAVEQNNSAGEELVSGERLRELYEQMVLIRLFEPEAERQYKAAKIGGYCHLATGQEAITVGAMHSLEDEDKLVIGYRSHGFALARGVPPRAVMAELFGREHGCAHGRGGSMHLLDASRGFLGGWGIVGGQLPIATGIAQALAQQGKKQAVLCELGDGAVNIGAWHESLNLASLWNLPVVFLIVNNEYGMGTSVSRASSEPELYKRACAYRMHGERVDGNDLEASIEATGRLLQTAREERRPAVLEAMTYRFRGHSVADAGLSYRTRDEIRERQEQHDTVARTGKLLVERGILEEEELDRIDERAREIVRDAVEFSDGNPQPSVDTLAEHVYGDPDFREQFARMRPGSPFGEDTLVFSKGLT